MAILISVHQLKKSFGARSLFEGLSFAIENSERIGLIGPNGAGKSTLLKILAGQMKTDSGEVSGTRGLRIGFLEQVPHFLEGATIGSTTLQFVDDPHDWENIARSQEILSRLELVEKNGFPEDFLISNLSGGWKKRVALARELMRNPSVLLLDEPTNHLDVESIMWLEDYLTDSAFATVTITHDRAFLQNVSDRIIELDRRNPGGLLSKVGTYADFLESKQLLQAGQIATEDRMRNTLRRETEWLRRGAKARTTKQKARIDRAGDLAGVVDDLAYRNRESTVRLDFVAAEKQPKKLIEAKGISKTYNGRLVVPPMDLLISPKTRLGLLGTNGCGKSTLLRMLLGVEAPDTGSVFLSDDLKVAYFDQNRESLNPKVSVIKTLCPMGDYVHLGDTPIHIRSYLDRFMFNHAQMDLPVGQLSGGEQSRLAIAKLMLQPANVLVLDEPTNDLDTATLDVLEDVLRDFQGAVLLVTHDRYFMDQVARTLLSFDLSDPQKTKLHTFSGLAQWEAWFANRPPVTLAKGVEIPKAIPAAAPEKPAKKLSFKEQKELTGIEVEIKLAETRLAEVQLETQAASQDGDSKRLVILSQEMAQLEAKIETLFKRWNELEV